MIQIVSFLPKHFESMVRCYRVGFPDGHNRYTLARLARFQCDSILCAVDETSQVVGVMIGITSAREAWFTALTLLPNLDQPKPLIARLAQDLSFRFMELGFTEAKLTTKRRSILRFVRAVGATNIQEESNYYFDNETRWIVTVNKDNLPLLSNLLT